ncbi:MAG: bacteriocin transport accessory protein [Lachnospiraceae bacterium]|nr:bacteriocin transport accessory protein [Lachnospiraceae bacterium]
MKKFISIMMVAVMMFSLTACGGGSKDNNTKLDADAVTVLNTVWETYGDDEKFPAAGGDMENSVMDAPGAFALADLEALDATLGVPASIAENIDNAASLMHMMNANTFTCGSYQLKDGADMETFTTALKDSIMNRQWMCGFPDTLIIVTLSDAHVVAAFGNAEIIETFKTKLTASYDGAEVIIEESLV